jgi:tetratricopeptide (TPR) repeat protein
MSLLLDALKRAEEAKRAKEAADAGGEVEPSTFDKEKRISFSDLSLEDYTEVIPPAPAPPEPSSAMLAGSDFSLAPDDETSAPAAESRYTAEAGLPPLPVPAPAAVTRKSEINEPAREERQRDTARVVFAAKQSADANPRGKWLLPLIAFAAVGIGVAGWYVWNEINRISRPLLKSISAPVPPIAVAPKDAPAAGNNALDGKASPPALPPLLPPPAEELAPANVAVRSSNLAAFTPRERLARNIREAPQTEPEPVGLKLTRSVDPPTVSPELLAAYEALVKGNFERAKNLYGQVAQREPLSIDAHLGLAAAAAYTNDLPLAARQYRQALEIDPRNSQAIAGLLAVAGTTRPDAIEVELKTLISRDPGAAPLYFSLGNLYAADRRWTEAQQAYFDAYRLDASNADYIFNLAVSLDQLNQRSLAMDYYKKALAQAAKTGGQFDRTAAQRRVAILQEG